MELESNSFLESNPKPSLTASLNTYWGSNRLSTSEIASLRQDQKEASVYLQKVFPNPRMMAMLRPPWRYPQLAQFAIDMAQRLLGNLQVDSRNARELLGWTPPFGFEAGVADMFGGAK